MQMIITERCPFYLPTTNIIRTKAKVRVSTKAGARSFKDLTSANIHILSDFSKQIKHEQFIKDIKWPKTQVTTLTTYGNVRVVMIFFSLSSVKSSSCKVKHNVEL